MNVVDKIKNVFDKVEQVYAIDVEICSDDVYRCRVVKLTKKDGIINFSQMEIEDSFDAVCSKISKQSPVCLLLNGKGILYRKLTVSNVLSEPDLIKTIIPNVKPEDFYLQEYIVSQENDKSDKLIALARKLQIDKVVSDFSEKFDFIVDVSINPFALDNILQVVSANNILYKNFSFEIKQQKIYNFNTNSNVNEVQIIEIENNSISSYLLPALALGFSFLFDYKSIDTSVAGINKKREEYIYKQKTLFTGKMALGVLFSLLLINFLVFDHFYKKVQSEQQMVINQENTIDRLKLLKDEFASKNRFLQQGGLLEQNKVSFYLDRLAATVPSNVTLTDLQLNPLINSRNKEEFNFSNNLMRVSGTSLSSSEFNEWMKSLKDDNVFNSVSIISYEHDLRTNSAVFNVELGY